MNLMTAELIFLSCACYRWNARRKKLIRKAPSQTITPQYRILFRKECCGIVKHGYCRQQYRYSGAILRGGRRTHDYSGVKRMRDSTPLPYPFLSALLLHKTGQTGHAASKKSPESHAGFRATAHPVQQTHGRVLAGLYSSNT